MSILTKNFRIDEAKKFVKAVNNESFSNDVDKFIYYLFYAKCLPWDVEPETETDSRNELSKIKREIYSLIKLNAGDVNTVIPRLDWVEGNKYDIYDSYVDFSDSNFYVVNSLNQVFKCLDNGKKSLTDAPNLTGSSANGNEPIKDVNDPLNTVTTPDGYIWKYIYTIPTNLANAFKTSNFIPVTTDEEIQDFVINNPGIIESIKYQYDRNDLVVISNQFNSGVYYTTIKGDGTGGLIEITVENVNSFSVITNVEIISGGLNYTVAYIDINDVYSDINLNTSTNFYPPSVTLNYEPTEYIKPIVSPLYGHGYDPESELYATSIMFSETLFGSVDNGNVPVSANINRYGIIKNPTDFSLNKLEDDTYYAADSIILNGNFNPVSGSLIQQNLDLDNDLATTEEEILLGVVVTTEYVQLSGSTKTIVKYYKTVDEKSLDDKNVYSINDIDTSLPVYVNNLSNPANVFNYTGNINNIDFTNGVGERKYKYDSGEIIKFVNINNSTRDAAKTDKITAVIEF